MIYFVDNARLDDLRKITQEKNIYTCKIRCLLDSYGITYNFAEFWIQYDEDNNAVSVISKFGADITVHITDKSNFEELKEFIEMVGFASILSREKFFSDSFSGIIMSKVSVLKKDTSAEINPDLNEVYKLLQTCDGNGFEVPSYKDFVLDMSHKIRHNTAICTGVRFNNILVSTAMTVALSDNSALIGAVATAPSYRHSGFGSICVNALCNILGDRKIFIMRDENENENFYKSLGFENTERFYLKKRGIL